ncbi:MAG: hypothetical protein CM1200mP41_11970 [Gammaproteobacteria bacterium]|nr:MAG: hypothetical protein CM1200mP41_11970 [Gammaproteobacteria bacterium]
MDLTYDQFSPRPGCHTRTTGPGGGKYFVHGFDAGLTGAPFSPVYSAAKWGVNGLMASLAGRLARTIFESIASVPDQSTPPMLNVFMARPDQNADRDTNLEMMKGNIPLKRVGTADEVANAALFLLSMRLPTSQASPYL